MNEKALSRTGLAEDSRASDLRVTDLVGDTIALPWEKCLAVGPQDGLPFLTVSRVPPWRPKVKEVQFSSGSRVY